MFLKQYNFLMSSILNQWQVLTKLRVELKEKKKRKFFSCKKFRYLAHNCRNSVEEEKEKPIPKNKFEVLTSQVIRYRVKEEVNVQRQERQKKEVRCFKC